MTDALFIQEGNMFIPSPLAHGPWSSRLLHGGATGGLMAYALEQCQPHPDMCMVRTTLDMFRPVPMAPLRVESTVLREGKRLQMLEATLFAGDQAVARSVGIRMKTTDVVVPEKHQAQSPVPEGPLGLQELKLSAGEDGQRLPGLNANLEIRRLYGFDGQGEGCAWIKVPVPVVAGVPNTPFVHLGIVSDFGNGLAQLFLPGTFGMINGDINLYFYRQPRGEWLALKSKAVMTPRGVGVVNTELYDVEGPVAQCHQAVMVQMR